MPYTLFVPTSYDPDVPIALIVVLHGLNITPLQQILFAGTADFAERYAFIVVAPMGFNLFGWWGSRPGNAVESAQMNPGTGARYTTGELSEIDAMKVLGLIRENYNVDDDGVYLMGHSMGGSGAYHLGGKFNDVWAGVAPLAGAGGITSAEAAASFASVPPCGSRRSVRSISRSRFPARITSSGSAEAPSTWNQGRGGATPGTPGG